MLAPVHHKEAGNRGSTLLLGLHYTGDGFYTVFLVHAAARMHFGEITHIIAGYNFPFQISTHTEEKKAPFSTLFYCY